MRLRLILYLLLLTAPFTSTGDISPATGANDSSSGVTAWTGTGNVVSNNTSGANCVAGASSQILAVTNYGFSIPDGATIVGVTVKVDGWESSGGTESITVTLRGVTGGSSKSQTMNGTTTLTYGSSSDLWGATISEAQVESSSFGVGIQFNTAHDVTIDHVPIAIEYVVSGSRRVSVIVTKLL